MKTFKEFFEQEPCSKEPISKFHLDQAEKHAKNYFDRVEQEENTNEAVAILPGGFKPPTKGHFLALQDLLKDADRGIVFIGKALREDREFITPEKSKRIWDIYAGYLDKPVEVIVSDLSPVKDTYDYADDNQFAKIIVGAGDKVDPKTGKKDIDRYDAFVKNKDKYPHVDVRPIAEKGDKISGTKVGDYFKKGDFDGAIDYFVPGELENVNMSETDKEIIKSLLANK